MKLKSQILSALLIAASSTAFASVNFIDPSIGTSEYVGWEVINSTSYPGAGGGHPGSSGWAIDENAGTGEGSLAVTAGSAYAGGESLYFGGFSVTPNTFGGTVELSTTAMSSSVQTVFLQMDMGSGPGDLLFWNDGGLQFPTLNIGGTDYGMAPLYAGVNQGEQNIGGNDVDVYTYYFQWNLTGEDITIDDVITAEFSMVQHGTIYNVELWQGETYNDVISTVPEPSNLAACFGLVALLFCCLRNRRKAA